MESNKVFFFVAHLGVPGDRLKIDSTEPASLRSPSVEGLRVVQDMAFKATWRRLVTDLMGVPQVKLQES